MTNYIEHLASGKTGTFSAKYDQHAERNGQAFTVLGAVDPTTYDAAECGDMFAIRFADGAQIEAWPEEVESAMKMSNYIEQPLESQDKADAPKNVLGTVAVPPFYIWANEDCDNKSDSFSEAKAIRLALFNGGGESVHIVDADGVEVVDTEIEAHEALAKAGYFAGARKPEVKPGFPGAFMVNDPQDPEGFAIVGDDIAALLIEARNHLIGTTAKTSAKEVLSGNECVTISV
ncbi:hypothetical protein [Diaphorobacter sp. J5-51]|uniref:hypothetical protein n=1 Tax=Diaphorobacter sp. J5-51 TaxID=680496 RepID=UPI000642EBAD|nr:hypothetical protein [Diaphorobacter sp. J5-51]KLR57140.1 hypothetical protein OX89_14000 [Diaphorobacter sp. J5-51]